MENELAINKRKKNKKKLDHAYVNMREN